MPRRLHVRSLHAGSVELDRDEAHHARNVLRLQAGDEVELFDDAGNVARGVIERCDAGAVVVLVDRVGTARMQTGGITVAAAVPKGERADWMIEKLSELGVERFIPLRTARSVVLPAGKNKRERWQRIAIESAKQSRRAGVMQIEDLVQLASLAIVPPVVYLSTEAGAASLVDFLLSQRDVANHPITLLIGPEGGWTAEEMRWMGERTLTGVRLTATILRVETAAVAAAAIVATCRARGEATTKPSGDMDAS